MENKIFMLSDDLIGAAVALCRAAETAPAGESAARALIEGLALSASPYATAEQLSAFTEMIRNEKYKLAPDCAVCAHPCGRTAEYPLRRLLTDGEPDVIQKKLALLAALRGLALACLDSLRAGTADSGIIGFFYPAVYALGYTYDADYYDGMIRRCAEYTLRLAAL